MHIPREERDERERLLEALREAALTERTVRVEAPIEAKRHASARIDAAAAEKKRLIFAARDAKATLAEIAAQLGIRNISQVSKLLKNGRDK